MKFDDIMFLLYYILIIIFMCRVSFKWGKFKGSDIIINPSLKQILKECLISYSTEYGLSKKETKKLFEKNKELIEKEFYSTEEYLDPIMGTEIINIFKKLER